MHKRILAIFVALVLLICICAIPAAADSADEDLPYIELTKFDDSLVMGIEPGAFYVMGDYGYVLDFSITLGQINAYGYEVTYSWSGNRPNVTGASFGNTTDNDFRNYYVDGTNLGKIRGSFRGVSGTDFGISFNSSGCYVTVHSVRIFVVENYYVELSAFLPDSSVFPGDDTTSLYTYSSIIVDSWRNYDLVEMSFTCFTDAVTSVSAVLMDNTSDLEIVIPCDVSYLNREFYQGTEKAVCITVSCDLRAVDPATTPDSSLVVRITANSNDGTLQMESVYGAVLIESPDEYLPWIKYIFLTLDQVFVNTNSISGAFDSFYNSFSHFIINVESYFAELNTSLLNSFDEFKTFWSSSLDEKLDALFSKIGELEANKWLNLYGPALDSIKDKLDAINNGTPADETVTQGMQDSANSLGSLGEQMTAGTPDIAVDDVNVDMNSLVSSGGMTSATNLAVVVTSQPLVQQMLLIVISLALVGFVFFGKRG